MFVFYSVTKENVGIAYQKYQCDLMHYLRVFSTGLTQLNWANRILNVKAKLEKYANESSTEFSQIITALENATNNGVSCKGDPSKTENALQILNSLRNCKTTIPSNCKLTCAMEDQIQIVEGCKPLLEKFNGEFKVSINKLCLH